MVQREWKPEQWQQVVFSDKTQADIGQNNCQFVEKIVREVEALLPQPTQNGQ